MLFVFGLCSRLGPDRLNRFVAVLGLGHSVLERSTSRNQHGLPDSESRSVRRQRGSASLVAEADLEATRTRGAP